MDGLPLADYIRSLDEQGAVRLAAALAQAERSLLGLPLEAVDFPRRTKARDGGADGTTSFPAELITSFPRGVRLWQVKSGHSAPNAEREFLPSKKTGDEKWVVTELKKGGVGYVLFWTYDPVTPEADATREAFRAEIRRVAPEAEVDFLFLTQIEALIRRHPGIAMSAMGLEGEGIFGPESWRKQFEGEFQGDPPRLSVIEAIRDHATSQGAGRRILRVFGDPGVGRSRAVFQAIDIDGIRERTLIATKASSTVVPELVARDPEASAVLVLDPASDADVAALRPYVSAADGRLVVVAVQERAGSEAASPEHLVVPPLERTAVRKLIDPANDGAKADEGLVLMAGGFPGLALQIRDVLGQRGPGAELVSVARDPNVNNRLVRLVPDTEDRDALAAIAPFGRVGVDGDVRIELRAIAAALGLDALNVAARLDRFEGRLVTRSGNHGRVSPDILALWLSEHAFAAFGARIIEAAATAPSGMAFAFLDRLAGMPGSAAATRVAHELAEREGFSPTTAADLTATKGRMLLALSVLDPAEGLRRVSAVLSSGDARLAIRNPDVLASLEELLWIESTFEPALKLLFRLAADDPSERTYGPRNLFEQVFQLALSGTQESYLDRVAAARRLLEDPGEGKSLVADVLGGAFDFSATRTVALHGRASTREDWYPTSLVERKASTKAAWDLVIELAHDGVCQAAAARSAAHAVRTCLRLGQGAFLESDLPAVDWAPSARAVLLHELRLARDHDNKLTAQHRAILERVMIALEGDSFAARLETAMAAEPHQLVSYSEHEANTYLDRMADDMSTDGANLALAVDASGTGNPQTVELLFREFGARSDEAAYDALVSAGAATPALVGFIAARDAAGSDAWATAKCAEWLASEGHLTDVPLLVLSLSPTDERVDIAVNAVGRGADAYRLSLLAYGGRVRQIAAGTIVRVIDVLQGSEGVVLENALGILAYWLEDDANTASPELVDAALRVVDASLADDGLSRSGMVGLYRGLILRKVPTDIGRLLPRVLNVLRSDDRLDEDELVLVCRATSIDETATIDAIVGLVGDAIGGTGVSMWSWRVASARLLSVLAGCTSPETVAEGLARVGTFELPRAFGHVAVHRPDGALDPMFEKLLRVGGESEDSWAAAARAFALPGGGHWGPESMYLESRSKAAAAIAASSEDPLIQRWASWVSGQLSERSEEVALRERGDYD